MTEKHNRRKVVACESCGEEHYVDPWDEPGMFPCVCGKWLEIKEDEEDYESEE